MKKMHKDYQKILKKFPALVPDAGRKHWKIWHPTLRDFVIASCTPRSSRSIKDFEADLHRLWTTGHGFIWKSQHIHGGIQND